MKRKLILCSLQFYQDSQIASLHFKVMTLDVFPHCLVVGWFDEENFTSWLLYCETKCLLKDNQPNQWWADVTETNLWSESHFQCPDWDNYIYGIFFFVPHVFSNNIKKHTCSYDQTWNRKDSQSNHLLLIHIFYQ